MKIRFRSDIAAGITLVALLLVSSPLPAFARQGSDDTSGSTTPTQTTETGEGIISPTSGSSSGGSGSGKRTIVSRDAASENESTTSSSDESLRNRAQQLLDDKRQNGKEHTEAQRQEACKQHESTIDGRFQTLGDKASRYLNGFNTIFTKVQAYQTKNQLNVPNYDTLVADVTAKQAAATAAVNTLDAQSGSKIDCTSSDPAQSVANVKTAAQDARTALQAYRASLKALVQALLSAKQAADTANTTGSN
jgi:hypothetical protein